MISVVTMNKKDVDLDALRAAARGVAYVGDGSTPNFTTYYDPAAPDGAALASALLLTSEGDLKNLEATFGIHSNWHAIFAVHRPRRVWCLPQLLR